ncbi:MAG: dinitrogenase iron-molybdenum cofactor biosynthesis protein [Desulfobulbaceae bacterium]|nr:MAG: dinitrogenase iron-molybdenum cofactor biosynthesis protein [Desulfobulbaceae bacterium]
MTIIPFPDQKGCGCNGPTWLTLPVAPQAVARLIFAGEDKLPAAVPLYGALNWLADLLEQDQAIAGLNLDGPGDPLASLALTLEILSQLQERYPQFPLALTTLGLGLADQVEELARHGAGRITLLVDAVEAETVKKLYRWIRPAKRNMPLARAAEILLREQTAALAACQKAGVPVTVLTAVYPGCNDHEIGAIAKHCADLGAEAMALLPGKGLDASGEKLPLPTAASMAVLAGQVAEHLELVEAHQAAERCQSAAQTAATLPKPSADRANVAVLSANGMDIDLHLGQAIKALIYGPREDGLACLLEARDLPEPGGGDSRWHQLAALLDDCFVLLATSAGQRPRHILSEHGLPLLLSEDNVEGSVDVLFGGGKKGKKGRK